MNEHVGRGLVLVVEDDDATRVALVEALAEHGYSAAGAKTFGAARVVLRRIAPDAIVLDLGLPDGDGANLLRHLRASSDPRLTALPVLVVSGWSDARERALGADAVVAKPVQARAVALALADLLARRTILRASGTS